MRRHLPALCGLILLSVAASAGEPPASVSDDVERLINSLAASEFETREAAEQRLREWGAPALGQLEAAVLNGSSDVAPRILALLERTFVEGCPDVADAAERSLSRLAASPNSEISRRARSVLVRHQLLRERRAVAAIRDWGGKVEYKQLSEMERAERLWRAGQPEFLSVNIPGRTLPAEVKIWLLAGWAGGEEGLWHVERLEDNWNVRLWGLEVTNVRGSGLSMHAVEALAAKLPGVNISERGASLGISGRSGQDVFVSSVIEGGPAALAGIKAGDTITSLDGRPLKSFDELVNTLKEYEPGAEVLIRVTRGVEPNEVVRVTLGNWNETMVGAEKPPTQPASDDGPLLPTPDFGPER